MASEDVFQRTFDPDRDSDNFKHIVNVQFVNQKSEVRNVTKEQIANEVWEMLNEMHKRYYENFTFKDLRSL